MTPAACDTAGTSAARGERTLADVVVVGGGVIGLTCAWELVRRGCSVTLLEQGELGRESSWAGAGILPPGGPPSSTPSGPSLTEPALRAASAARWPLLSAELRDLTGIDNGYRACGGIELRCDGPADELDAEMAAWRAEGVAVRPLDLARNPLAEYGAAGALSPRVTAAYELPGLAQVRNPRHLKALAAACRLRGVDIREGVPVREILARGDTVWGVRTTEDRLDAGRVVVAAGAWTRALLPQVDVFPVRGQIVLLSVPRTLFTHVLQVGPRYIVPRPDGRILVGSTEEQVGFDRRTTAAGVAGLIDFAVSLVPALAGAAVERTWAGLRPGTAQPLPFIGPVPGIAGLFVAAGHFRAGLLLSPATGERIAQLVCGEAPPPPA